MSVDPTHLSRRTRGWAATALLVFACTRHTELGSDLRGAVPSDGGATTGGQGGSAGAPSCVVRECDGKRYVCGDCHDNDGDGLTDDQDPECSGACDDTESTFDTDIEGQSDATCKLDCFFDGDNGSGNDDCHWSHRCDPLSTAPDYPPSGDTQCAYDPSTTLPGTAQGCESLRAAQSDACRAACLPLTPPGCDCFGCCEYPNGSGNFIWLGSLASGVSRCDSTSLLDPTRCHPCTPVTGCKN